jgi:hypothetical protein
MKKKFNLVGNTFTHLTDGNKGYSVHGKESKYIEWVKDGSGEVTFYIDSTLAQAQIDETSGPKYGWLLESKYITPQIVDSVRMFPEKYLETFDLIFTHNQDLLKLDSKFKWVPAQGFWIKEPKIYEKSKMISMIASNKKMCEGHRLRLQWVERLWGQVDMYGRGFNEIALKEEGLCDYMFSVAIENGQYETYFTEKLLDCFATGTIPVYLGAPDIGKIFNIDGIITLSDEFDISDEVYYSKMDAIKENLEIAKTMEILEDFIYLNYFNE